MMLSEKFSKREGEALKSSNFQGCIAQVAIITGSGQGLGAAAAKLFAQHGAKIVVSDIDSQKAEHVSQTFFRCPRQYI